MDARVSAQGGLGAGEGTEPRLLLWLYSCPLPYWGGVPKEQGCVGHDPTANRIAGKSRAREMGDKEERK